jgi:hypothetical protein
MKHCLTKFELETTLYVLEKIKNKRTFEHAGICANVGIALKKHCIEEFERGLIADWLTKLMSKWPKSSGELSTPVPEGAFPEGFSSYYEYASYYNTMWDATTEYGKLRFELLDFLISTVKTEVEWL